MPNPNLSRLKRELARVSAAAVDASPTLEQLHSLVPDIESCSQQAQKLDAADLMQLKATYLLGQMAILPLRVFAAAATALPEVPHDVTHMTKELAGTLMIVMSNLKVKEKEFCFPSGGRGSCVTKCKHTTLCSPAVVQNRIDGYLRQQQGVSIYSGSLMGTCLVAAGKVWVCMRYSSTNTSPLASCLCVLRQPCQQRC